MMWGVAPRAGMWPFVGASGAVGAGWCWLARTGVDDVRKGFDAAVASKARWADASGVTGRPWVRARLSGDDDAVIAVARVEEGFVLGARGLTGLFTDGAQGWRPLLPADHPLFQGSDGLLVVPRLPDRVRVAFGGDEPGVDVPELAWGG